MQVSLFTANKFIPNFGSTKRTTYFNKDKGFYVLPSYDVLEIQSGEKEGVKVVDSNSTSFFRTDLDWDELGFEINSQFPQDKVNTYIFGCSDGSEAYSLAVALIEQLGLETAKKYFPILASDVDGEMVKQAQSGKVCATEKDILKFVKMVKNRQLGKYFIPSKKDEDTFEFTMSKILTDNIIFCQEDISDGINKLGNGPNLIFCRNFWRYLSPEKIADVTWMMKNKFDETSRIVIGAYDQKNSKTPFFLEDIGFQSLPQNHDFYESPILKLDGCNNNEFLSNKESWLAHIKELHAGYKLDYLY